MKITEEEQTYRENVQEKLTKILVQTQLTNGRVTKLEKVVLVIVTATSVTVALKFPFIASLISAL